MRWTLALLLFALPSFGQDQKPERKDLTANLCVRGKLLFSDDFSGSELSKEWKIAKGKWEILQGALRGSEIATDQHAAVIKHALPGKNVVLQFKFRFLGAKTAACSFDGKGHVCRVVLNSQGFTLRRDVAKDSGEKPATLGKGEVELKPEEWHTMLIEIQGKEMLAQVDDKVFAFGEHAGVDNDKATFGFPVSGESFVVGDVRVWEASPSPDWPANRQKLASAGK